MLPPLGFPSLSTLFLEHNYVWKEPIWILYSTGHTFESFFFLLSSLSRSFSLWFMDLETSFNYIPRTAAWSDAHQELDRCSVQPPGFCIATCCMDWPLIHRVKGTVPVAMLFGYECVQICLCTHTDYFMHTNLYLFSLCSIVSTPEWLLQGAY